MTASSSHALPPDYYLTLSRNVTLIHVVYFSTIYYRRLTSHQDPKLSSVVSVPSHWDLLNWQKAQNKFCQKLQDLERISPPLQNRNFITAVFPSHVDSTSYLTSCTSSVISVMWQISTNVSVKPSTLNFRTEVEAASFSERVFYRTTWRHIPEHINFYRSLMLSS